MFPFKKKKKQPEPPKPTTPCEDVRRKLTETDTRLDKAIKEMNRRIQERQTSSMTLVTR